MLNKMGIDPETYFSKTCYHRQPRERGARAAQGTVEVAANWWNDAGRFQPHPHAQQGHAEEADGSPMKEDDFRIILKSDLIINSPYAYLADLPDDMKAAIAKAFFDAPTKAPRRFRQALRRQEQAVGAGHQRRLRRDHRADQVRRRSAQEEELSRPTPAAGADALAAPPEDPALSSAVVLLPDRQLAALRGAYARRCAPARAQPRRPRDRAGAGRGVVGAGRDRSRHDVATRSAASSAISTASARWTAARACGPTRSNGSGACGDGRGCSARRC